MNIIEAIKSGKRFQLKNSGEYDWIDPCGEVQWADFYLKDLISNDWEIEEEKIEITRTNLHDALMRCHKKYKIVWLYEPGQSDSPENILAKELGFK